MAQTEKKNENKKGQINKTTVKEKGDKVRVPQTGLLQQEKKELRNH